MLQRVSCWMSLLCAAMLAVSGGRAAAQSAPDPQEKPLFDKYDLFLLSAVGAYGRFLNSTCTQSDVIASQIHCSRKVTAYASDQQGALLQFISERLSRRQGENLARLIQQPLNNDPEVVQGARRAAEDCNRGIQRSCVELGLLTVKGWGVPRNQQRADLLFRKACAAGETEGCGYLAIGYERNYPKEAADLFDRACFAGQGESYACERLAALSEQGRGVPKDASVAAALYKRRCEKWNNDASKCEEWQRVSKLGVQPADIGSRFAPQPDSNQATPSTP